MIVENKPSKYWCSNCLNTFTENQIKKKLVNGRGYTCPKCGYVLTLISKEKNRG